jgi:hypothetical protein
MVLHLAVMHRHYFRCRVQPILSWQLLEVVVVEALPAQEVLVEVVEVGPVVNLGLVRLGQLEVQAALAALDCTELEGLFRL